MQVLNTFYFLVGYLGFLSTWIMDTIFLFVRNATLDWYNRVTSHALRAASPHFVLARGLYDISQVTPTSQWLPVHRLCQVLSTPYAKSFPMVAILTECTTLAEGLRHWCRRAQVMLRSPWAGQCLDL